MIEKEVKAAQEFQFPDKSIELHCIGNALIDVFAQGDEGVNYGLRYPVQHIKMEKLKLILSMLNPGEKKTGKKTFAIECSSGGGAANAAKIAGFLGAKVSFTGAIGAEAGSAAAGGKKPDRFGRLFKKQLGDAGVKLNLIYKPLPTGICLMLKTGGKNRIAASPSAALKLSKSDINAALIKKAALVVVDGFMLSRPPLVRRILTLAEQYETIAALDLGSVSIAKEHAEEILDFARRYSIILFMNEYEASAFLMGLIKLKGEKPALKQSGEFFKSLSKGKFPIILVKLGERGAMCFAGGRQLNIKANTLNSLDSTGAGDAFCAAFLTAWVRGKSLYDCADLGNKAGGIVLNAMGANADKLAFKSLERLLD
jgi:sugar/nucleoside kinase (ribokinase family)